MGALRVYGRGWTRGCDYSGTATRSEFWWFTLIHAVVYVGAQSSVLLVTLAWSMSDRNWHSDRLAVLFDLLVLWLVLTVVMAAIIVAPWTSLLVRRVRAATASSIAALVLALTAYAGLIAVPLTLAASLDESDPFAPVFQLLAVVAFAAVAVVSALPSREPEDIEAD